MLHVVVKAKPKGVTFISSTIIHTLQIMYYRLFMFAFCPAVVVARLAQKVVLKLKHGDQF